MFPLFFQCPHFLLRHEFQILQCRTSPLAQTDTDAELVSGSAFSHPSFFPRIRVSKFITLPTDVFSRIRDLRPFSSSAFALSHITLYSASVRPLPFRYLNRVLFGQHLCWCQVDRTVSKFELIASQPFASRLLAGSEVLVPCRCSSNSQLLSTCPSFC